MISAEEDDERIKELEAELKRLQAQVDETAMETELLRMQNAEFHKLHQHILDLRQQEVSASMNSA